MYNLYTYARSRLFGSTFQRDQFLSILVKRTLKSVARSTGGRINRNKWFGLLDALVTSCPTEKGIALLDAFLAEVKKHGRTHQQTILRIEFLIEYIRASRIADTRSIGQVFDAFLPKFAAQDTTAWLFNAAEAAEYFQAGCGHFEYHRHNVTLCGDVNDVQNISSACAACGNASLESGERVMDTHNYLILAQYAVSCRAHYGSQIHDSRDPNVVYDPVRLFYHVRGWSPYTNLIDGYHSSKAKGFKVIESPWFTSNRRAFGVELEVQVRSGDKNAAAGRVHEALNPSLDVGEFCYFERDGSIGEGFEIVTQPAGLDVHRSKWALFLQNNELKRGLRSHEGGACGLHVHVGREFVTQSQIYRIQSFLNDVRNEALIRSIARRYENGYCKFKPTMAKFTAHNKQTGDRYEALNVTNPDTIEFRIFRGSLRYESVIAALEFCNALLTFCTPGVTSLIDFTAVGFKKFITRPDNRIDTKYLRSYLSLDTNNDNERQAA